MAAGIGVAEAEAETEAEAEAEGQAEAEAEGQAVESACSHEASSIDHVEMGAEGTAAQNVAAARDWEGVGVGDVTMEVARDGGNDRFKPPRRYQRAIVNDFESVQCQDGVGVGAAGANDQMPVDLGQTPCVTILPKARPPSQDTSFFFCSGPSICCGARVEHKETV